MKNITDYLEKEQVDQVLAAAYQCSTRDYLMLRVFWRTGVRVNELLTITPRDIESRNNIVNVTKAKGGKQRRVPLDPETVRMLSDYVSRSKIKEDRPIFSIRQRWAREIVRRYGARIGRRDLHPHTFRHSFAIHCVRSGWDIRRLQHLQFNDRDIRELYDRTAF
jgi:integrase/recombinase XerD